MRDFVWADVRDGMIDTRGLARGTRTELFYRIHALITGIELGRDRMHGVPQAPQWIVMDDHGMYVGETDTPALTSTYARKFSSETNALAWISNNGTPDLHLTVVEVL